MKKSLSRRDLRLLLPAVAAAARAHAAPAAPLPSKVYHHEAIPYEGDAQKKGRRFFDGATHAGFEVEVHETILGAGTATHAPHRHVHEEIVIVVEGTVEAWLEGKTEIAQAGSVFYFGSDQMHSARNAGTTPCRYYVLELRGSQA